MVYNNTQEKQPIEDKTVVVDDNKKEDALVNDQLQKMQQQISALQQEVKTLKSEIKQLKSNTTTPAIVPNPPQTTQKATTVTNTTSSQPQTPSKNDITNVKAYFATNSRELFVDPEKKMTWREENGEQFGETVTLAADGTFTITGNKTLAPAYLNTASIRYINTDRKAGTTFTFSGEYTISGNYFCDSLVVNNPDFVVMKDDDGKDILLGKDNQFVKPINMGGYHKMLFKTSFAMPVDFIMCNFNIGAQASLQRLPGMINEEKVPIERNWYQLSGRLDSNISKDIDFTVSYSARYTSNQYSGKFGSIDNSFITHKAQAQIRYIMPWEFVFTGGFIYSNTRSIKGLYNDNIYLCDLFIGRRFLENKKLEINIGVNDLFNDSIRSYWHTVSSSGKTDGINSGLGRYFSIQCIWHFGNR